jgi:hypothetical protein
LRLDDPLDPHPNDEEHPMRRVRPLCGATVLAALAILSPRAAAQTPLHGTWVLDQERSENVREMYAARFGGAPMARAGDGAGAGAVIRGGGGGAGGRMIVRGGGPLVGSLVRGGERVRIELGTASVTVHIDDEAPFTLPLSGEEIELTRWGNAVIARAGLANGTLTIESVGEYEVAVTETFTATERGEIDAELNITFPQMGGPLTMAAKRVYVKVAEGTR